MSGAVGVLGGAFNPPHLGHLILAEQAREQLALDELLLVPTGIAPHKRIEPEPGAAVRLELTRLAVAGVEGTRASDVEVRREGPSFAYRTLEVLAHELPGSDLIFVMGADAAAGLGGWRRPERILELARVAIAERPGITRSEVDSALARVLPASRSEVVEMPEIGISSTEVRERVATDRSIRWLVPESVQRLIAERGLYRGRG